MKSSLRSLIVALGALAGLLAASAAQALPVDPASATTDGWLPIVHPVTLPDFDDDQQTGQHDSDIVGNLTDPALYVQFDGAGTPSAVDGTLGFRVRLGTSKKGVFEHAFLVGIDAASDGDIDLYLGVNNSGGKADVGIWDAGSDTNTSPSTTSIVSVPLRRWDEIASNYSYVPVDTNIDPPTSTTDVDGDGENDYFLTFVVDFQQVVNEIAAKAPGFNEDSVFSVVTATSNQVNALNNDLGGPPKNYDTAWTWSQLGAISVPMQASQVPEPDTGVLFGLGLVVLGALRRREH